MTEAHTQGPGFTIMRAGEAPDLGDTDCLTFVPGTETQTKGAVALVDHGLLDGQEVKVLCNLPGFNLTHVWFKRNFPLPLHSHNTDCLYYIIAGSLRLGTETLGAQDSFFIPVNVPYTYTPGLDGVELLEIRHAQHFNIVNHAKGPNWWAKALNTVISNRADWQKAKRPAPH
ncbi:hypothetical protein [Sphingobium tyrosinilyticum]|uniref:Cupin domain-containing protein n=1 Tax=Sphingobium tyrosinilyticum TaxID=2715436 RepID=A0ABV9F1J4_9SPHN